MSSRLLRGFGIASCLLLAVGIGSPDAGVRMGPATPGRAKTLFIATFVPGCEQAAPRIRTTLVQAGHPKARAGDAGVALYFAGDPVPGAPRVIGHVELRARGRNTSLDNLVEYARREARRVGGDVLVDARPGEARPDPRGPGHSPLMLTADIATSN